MTILLAEDLLLLCTDDASGSRTIQRQRLDRGLAIALILELRLLGAVHLEPGDGGPRSGRLHRVPTVHVQDELLDRAARATAGRRTTACWTRGARCAGGATLRSMLTASMRCARVCGRCSLDSVHRMSGRPC